MLVNMNDILLPAKEEHYGVGFFNAVNVEMARAVIETAEELHSPVMIGTAEVLLPTTNLNLVADYLLPMAREASVPVAVHYDHGLTFDRCMQALRLGFSSVMFDCSTKSYEDNAEAVAEMVKICHGMGVTVEGELGHVGDNEGAGKLAKPSDYFTDPDMAVDYVKKTGIDALAIAVGNAQLHGGSGLSDDDFREAVKRGICKINIFTDLDKAGKKGVAIGLEEGAASMCSLIPYEIEAMKAVVSEKIYLFGSMGKA